MKKHVNLTLDVEILARIDENRGIAKRSTYINDMLRKVETDEEKW